MFTWEALIMGPKDTPFEGGVFSAKLTFVRVSCPPGVLTVSHVLIINAGLAA